MDYLNVKIKSGDVIVVAFDICSSSDIIEELMLKGRIGHYQKLLEKIKHHLAEAQKKILFEPYKFTGDGWMLLFPVESQKGASPAADSKLLVQFLKDLCSYFKRVFDLIVMRDLDTPPAITGINFGIARGPLIYMKVFGKDEYLGRALILACRLQGKLKEIDEAPAYKALVTNEVFDEYLSQANGLEAVSETVKLHNIRGGAEFRCRRVGLDK